MPDIVTDEKGLRGHQHASTQLLVHDCAFICRAQHVHLQVQCYILVMGITGVDLSGKMRMRRSLGCAKVGASGSHGEAQAGCEARQGRCRHQENTSFGEYMGSRDKAALRSCQDPAKLGLVKLQP